jgi:hypothetical protein
MTRTWQEHWQDIAMILLSPCPCHDKSVARVLQDHGTTNMARALPSHDDQSMASTWQGHDKSMATTCQEHGNIFT